MGTAFTVLRWVHILAGAAWFGEVVVVNLVLVPLVSKSAHESQIAFLARVFPSIFRSWVPRSFWELQRIGARCK